MKLFGLVVVVLAAPIVPALLVAADWDQQLAAAVTPDDDEFSAATAFAIGGLLAADVFLPIPSGPLATLAGASLGLLPAVIVVWIGLTGGAMLGFAAARWMGRPLAVRLAGEDSVEQLQAVFHDRAEWMLLVTRPLPILAEAAVLLAGVAGVSWRRFALPIVSGSLAFAVVLAAVGRYAADHEVLTTALTLSVIVPLAATAWLRRRWRELN